MNPLPETLSELSLDLDSHSSGKVRESWLLPTGERLIVTTDRLSAFDRIIGCVQHKGQVLNQLSAWWFDRTGDIVQNHLIEACDPNAMVVTNSQPLPVEVVMRSRLTGSTSTSMLPRYLAGERLMYGFDLPDGLTEHGPLPENLLTPATKAQNGAHDEPLSADEVLDRGLVSSAVWAQVEKVAHQLFEFGAEVARQKGYVLADTKYEFGLDPDGRLMLIDEIHTPDSSRYWKLEGLQERLASGLGPESYDKEPVRLALKEAGYSGDGEIPELPLDVWEQTSQRYVQLYEDLTGLAFRPGQRPIAERISTSVSTLTM